ncbi:MAG: DNA topoisomerase I [Deltaproteobacteria bacterium]|nr:MAG: DNA topoisomerase I [Deltaproteobacteria bacterium]
MTKPLIIVESPTKVKTIKKYVGDTYNVTATSGHIKDLPTKEFGIDIEKNFSPTYVNIKGKQKIIQSLKAAAANASEDIYLAPDPDREGEAIAFHTAEILKKKERRFHRVLFNELTKNGILSALNTPLTLNPDKYDAQQTRRILDRLVGYQISPILWRKVQGGLSAGRVQSVTVRMICERERAIQAFEPKEYWTLTADLEGDTPPGFTAKLTRIRGKKAEIPNEKTARSITDALGQSRFQVEKVIRKTTKRNPLPPFITSKLQQEAIRKLRFSAKKTMMIAQQLYEGIDLGPQDTVGLITYMRTDSTRISVDAANEAMGFIKETWGADYALSAPRFFKNKNKAQDAHEAIRPTSVYLTPEKVKRYLSEDQFSLYGLIWKRFVASQMAQALIDQKTITVTAGDYTLTATGSTVKFPGFMRLYLSVDDAIESNKDKQPLPDLADGMWLKLLKLDPAQHFTVPPPRFTEASLVKELEENGIGRPSTYTNILTTIQSKGYVDLVNRQFRPSELGFIVNDLLVDNFPTVLDVDFTARLETDLDQIEAGDTQSVTVLTQFYDRFQQRLEAAKSDMQNVKGVGIPTGMSCPECNRELHIKVGRNGPFIACEGYPECAFSRNYERDEKGNLTIVQPQLDAAEGKVCAKCNRPMTVKQGRYGSFLACTGYPECKHTQSITEGGASPSTGVTCPAPDCDGELVEKKSKRGKVFYGCNRYPDCTYAIWDKPVDRKCPDCEAPFLVEKTTKRDGRFLKCLTDGCGYREMIDD